MMENIGISLPQAVSAGGTIFLIGMLFGWFWARIHSGGETNQNKREE